ncbi:YfhO family protein [Lachnospiraceae bacterium HCP1S3_A10]
MFFTILSTNIRLAIEYANVRNFKYTDTEFNLKFNNSQEGLMLLSVPYSSGYKAYTDSIRSDILTVDGGLMAICIPSGSKSITFNYKEPGLTAGLCISMAGILILAAYLITDSIIKKRRHV